MTVWMDTAKPGRKPRTSRRIILVLGVSAIVIASAFAVWVLFVATGTGLAAVSPGGGGILLAYTATGPNGVVHYEILTANGRAYRPDTLPATFRKSVPIQGSNPALPAGGPIDSPARWRDFGALQFLGASGAYSEFPLVDDMPSLAAGVSRNGSLRFVDTNVDGLVDDGDRLDVNLAATGSPTGWSLAFMDATGDGRLDSGDVFLVGGLANHTSVSLYLAQGNASVGTIAWVVGYGEPIGRLPPLIFTTQGTNPWQATANAWFWSPELALNRTIRASLLENGIAVLTNVSVVGGILGTFANGTLAFTDSDGDGSLSTGDVFTVTGASGNRYELDVSVLYETAWRAYM